MCFKECGGFETKTRITSELNRVKGKQTGKYGTRQGKKKVIQVSKKDEPIDYSQITQKRPNHKCTTL